MVNLLGTTTRAPSAFKLDTRWRFRACHNTRWRFRAWFLVRTPGSQTLSHETPQPQARGLRSDEKSGEYSHPDPHPTRPSPKRTFCRPIDQPALRSLLLRSFIFNANNMDISSHATMEHAQFQSATSKLDVCGKPESRQSPARKGGAPWPTTTEEMRRETLYAPSAGMDKTN